MPQPDLKADSSFSSLAVNMESCFNTILLQTGEFIYKGMELFKASHGGWPLTNNKFDIEPKNRDSK
jgi:hypothetical protein